MYFRTLFLAFVTLTVTVSAIPVSGTDAEADTDNHICARNAVPEPGCAFKRTIALDISQ
ncbi:e0e854d3-b118-4833-a8fa-561c01e6b9cc [Sclerotinia trifoliorum]|uniref:E0e854d3-b118-4833-a8fa-561c01e6b9cc n=1 Tax=Sclerotinia trifoliorum TaxID=28548 RepID=A0A8H2ZT13_9HELO|nr:e0e854d3-b118-4833-a8fa-561c01e6b9cc [Sclerotinia trifoliorum]